MNDTKEKHALQIVINEAEISALGDGDLRVLKAVEITKANARLIAAAPELLEQCKLFEKVLRACIMAGVTWYERRNAMSVITYSPV